MDQGTAPENDQPTNRNPRDLSSAIREIQSMQRALDIETALERVRSRTMAMHRSNELHEVSELLYAELKTLVDFSDFTSCGYIEVDEKNHVQNAWMTRPDGTSIGDHGLPLKGDPVMNARFEAWKARLPIFHQELNSAQLKKHWAFVRPNFKNEEVEAILKSLPDPTIFYCANFKYGYLHIIMGKPLTNEGESILIRFTQVFSQSYTRFLDLKRAEEQSREAEIQLALERVRARTMAMQNSQELSEVASVLFRQLTSLGLEPMACGFGILDDRHFNQYFSVNGKVFPESLPIPYDITPTLRKVYTAWKKGNKIHHHDLKGKSLEAHSQPILKYLASVGVQLPVEAIERKNHRQVDYHAYFSQGCLLFSYDHLVEESDLFIRFARVFDQTYSRFLDLQKAEAQTRESEIQLALERVRARTMAMHKSNELGDVALVLFEQLELLGIKTWSTGFNIWLEGNTSYMDWVVAGSSGKFLEPYKVDLTTHPFFREVSKAKNRGDDFFVIEAEGEELAELYRLLFQMANTHFENIIDPGIQLPERQFNHYVFGAKVSLMFITFEAVPEVHEIFNRFGKAFEQSYTRFLDLQKAEAQAREAEIQLGLERVRARAMAMQSSEELSELIGTVFTELTKLDLVLTRCIILIFDPDTKGSMWWMANSEDPDRPSGYFVKYHKAPPYLAYLKAWKAKSTNWLYVLEGKEKIDWDEEIFTQTELSNLPDFVIEGMKAPERVFLTASFNQFGCLNVASLEPLNEEQTEILERFASAFNLTYTRFNDLQQAEAQAREAEIQLALERVRARTMAMHHSAELGATSLLLFDELRALGEISEQISIGIFDEENQVLNLYATVQGEQWKEASKIELDEPYVMQKIYCGWKQNKKSIQIDLSGEELKAYNRFRSQYSKLKFPEKRWVIHCAFFSKGVLTFSTTNPHDEPTMQLLERFAKVFDGTYTRFLDLKQAEAQAREAEIQLALERVRARTMAMHRSDELPETSHLLFEQMKAFGEPVEQLTIGIINEENKVVEISATLLGDTLQKIHRHSIDEPYMMNKIYKAWKKQQKTLVVELRGNELNAYNKYRNELTNSEIFPTNFGEEHRRIVYAAFFSKGMLALGAHEPRPPESIQLLERFASAFDLTYTRFLDLKKAEEQMREAQIEAALERVRSRTMAMHQSDELSVVVNELFEQMNPFGLGEWGFQVRIAKEEGNGFYAWLSTPDQRVLPQRYDIPTLDHWVIQKYWTIYEKQIPYDVIEVSGEDKRRMDNLLFKESELENLPTAVQQGILDANYVLFSVASMKYGLLEAIDVQPKGDEKIDILKRFAKVFEQTYTRFLDLQKAEAQTRDAIKQAALDRVRGEIASMRHSEDLNRITPLIWRELRALEIPFIRCGVFIIDQETNNVELYLTSPEGKALAVLHFAPDANTLTQETVRHWQKEELYKTHWDQQDFINWMRSMIDTGQVQDAETYQGASAPPESLDLHFVPFRQGMLYVGDVAPLTDDKLELVKTLAEAFSIAYARYEDFRNLESAKQEVEYTLHELKQAQAQLIQSEKMASLGELTAGIAHEIQNPLNFVNNFSEVNRELIDEFMDEWSKDKGERDEVLEKELLHNIRANGEKINEHGKRAEGIVKSMLQHSRSSSGKKEPTDINVLCNEYLRLALHVLRAKDKNFNADLMTEFDPDLPKIKVIPQDIGRVLLNIINNGFQALQGVKNPVLSVSTKYSGDQIEIQITDNGPGIPDEIKDKIFQPFFTTKPTGQGTGLGLSLAYDIVKALGGDLLVESKVGQGTAFIVHIPFN